MPAVLELDSAGEGGAGEQVELAGRSGVAVAAAAAEL
jgi:hypothetical protein